MHIYIYIHTCFSNSGETKTKASTVNPGKSHKSLAKAQQKTKAMLNKFEYPVTWAFKQHFIMVPLRKKVLKYGTPKPSYFRPLDYPMG